MKRTWLRNGAMQALRLLACGVFVTALAGCDGQIIGPPTPPGTPPPPRALWLSYKYSAGGCTDPNTNCPEIINQVEEDAYYCSIACDGRQRRRTALILLTLPIVRRTSLRSSTSIPGRWRTVFQRTGAPDAHAIYGNLGDLRIGRDMNCVKSANGNIACYVTNYGFPPFVNGAVNPDWVGSNNEFPGLTQAVEDAIAGHDPFATVAMVYNRSAALNQSANAVTFYVFKGNGDRLPLPALDAEGGKSNPRMCMACHGGDVRLRHAFGQGCAVPAVRRLLLRAQPAAGIHARQSAGRISTAERASEGDAACTYSNYASDCDRGFYRRDVSQHGRHAGDRGHRR